MLRVSEIQICLKGPSSLYFFFFFCNPGGASAAGSVSRGSVRGVAEPGLPLAPV